MKIIRYIPKKEEKNGKLKVAAYCRVSTKEKHQKESLNYQIEYYTNLIKNNPKYIFVGVFYDYGSGLRIKGRAALEKMLKLAYEERIDLIIIKSISRVSRNTVNSLTIIRKLRERGINMYFENENLNSIEMDNELEITLRSAIAQNEIENLSEDVSWGYQRKFESGDIFVKYKNFMGYTFENNHLVIVPQEAKTVKLIFSLYLKGYTFNQIKKYLEENSIKTATKKDIWSASVIQKMLKNEKYSGCTMMQKTYTENYLTGKRKRNIGQRKRYYIEDTHPPIISKDIFKAVQEEMEKRARLIYKDDCMAVSSNRKYSGKYLFSNLLVCGHCGSSYRRRTERDKIVWRCATRIEKGR